MYIKYSTGSRGIFCKLASPSFFRFSRLTMDQGRCRTAIRIREIYDEFHPSRDYNLQSENFPSRIKKVQALPRPLCEQAARCRPRLPRLMIRTNCSRSNLNRKVDIAYLQDYTDRLNALRECILIMFNSVTEVYRRLDLHGTGFLSPSEIGAGLTELRVPWQQVTGLTHAQFFDLVDPTKSGSIDILSFLGKTFLTPRPPWNSLSIQEQWEEYCRRVVEMDLMNMIPSQPLWRPQSDSKIDHPYSAVPRENMNFSHERGNSGSIRRFEDELGPISREDLDFIQTKLVRIEKFLKEFNESKRELSRIKHELSNITESVERATELKRKREEEEREKQRLKTEAGMALVSSENGRISLFGKHRGLIFSQFIKPTESELLTFFSLSNPSLISRDEVHFRNLLRSIGISPIDGDKVKQLFLKHSGASLNADQDQFILVLRDLLKISPDFVPISRFRGYWFTAGSGKERISLNDFLVWYANSGILNA